MKPRDWFLRVMLTLLVIGVWVLILKPVLAPTPSQAAQAKQPVPKVLRAERFELVDSRGRGLASLVVNQGVSPVLRLRDQREEIRAELGLAGNGSPELRLRSPLHGTQPVMSVGDALYDQGARLLLIHHGRRAEFSLSEDGTPSLTLWDAQGKVRAAVGATDLETIRTGSAEKRPESSLVLFDKEGKVIWKAPPE